MTSHPQPRRAPEPCTRHTPAEHEVSEALLRRLAVGLDIPPWVLGVGPPPTPTLAGRLRVARWRARGHLHRGRATLAGLVEAGADRLGDALAHAGDLVDTAGDHLADRLRGR